MHDRFCDLDSPISQGNKDSFTFKIAQVFLCHSSSANANDTAVVNDKESISTSIYL